LRSSEQAGTIGTMVEPTNLSIGETARRSGLTVATLRYYEQRGLISATRTAGNQRR